MPQDKSCFPPRWFPTTLIICQIFCLSNTLKAAHYLSTPLELGIVPNTSFLQPVLLLKIFQPHTRALPSEDAVGWGRSRTRPGYFFSGSEQDFVHCTFMEATGEGKPQVFPALEETKQLIHSTWLLLNFKHVPLLRPLTILERNSDFE